jgi:uncharacterized lipoprotein NlpE involved in copper resistance
MKNKIIFLICVSFLFLNCKKEIETEEVKIDNTVKVAVKQATDSHNSQNSLDWQGTYKGIMPCADCEGIETEVILNIDLTFIIKTKYIGKNEGKVLEENGNFVWDKNGNTINFEGIKGKPSQYKVGENRLIQLDMEGNIISGALAEKYILTK